jgi:hypothetical protein
MGLGMYTICRQIELIAQSQGEGSSLAQGRAIQLRSARLAPNGNQKAEKPMPDISVRRSNKRRQAEVRLPGIGEEVAYALLWSKM